MTARHWDDTFFFPTVHERHRAKGLPLEEQEKISRDRWLDELVQLVPMSGRVRTLLRVKRERCVHCPMGTRTVSIWVTPQGKGEAVAWCGHCFNATCERYPLDDEHRARFDALQTTVSEEAPPVPWRAARLALEDLERRGVL